MPYSLFIFAAAQNELSTYGFETPRKTACKHLWRCCVEHHAFFRMVRIAPLPNSQSNNSDLFQLGSRLRYRWVITEWLFDFVDKVLNICDDLGNLVLEIWSDRKIVKFVLKILMITNVFIYFKKMYMNILYIFKNVRNISAKYITRKCCNLFLKILFLTS